MGVKGISNDAIIRIRHMPEKDSLVAVINNNQHHQALSHLTGVVFCSAFPLNPVNSHVSSNPKIHHQIDSLIIFL